MNLISKLINEEKALYQKAYNLFIKECNFSSYNESSINNIILTTYLNFLITRRVFSENPKEKLICSKLEKIININIVNEFILFIEPLIYEEVTFTNLMKQYIDYKYKTMELNI